MNDVLVVNSYIHILAISYWRWFISNIDVTDCLLILTSNSWLYTEQSRYFQHIAYFHTLKALFGFISILDTHIT